jgi:hypothetical protein
MRSAWRAWSLILTALALSGCTYHRTGDVPVHYMDFQTEEPRGNRITHCHAYGCKRQTRFTFTRNDIATIASVMTTTRKADTPHEERRAVAYAIAWMEKRVGDVTGTSADRPGDDFAGVGDPTQMDCVDTATNSTNYLLVLQHNGFLRHHKVGTPFSKEDLTRGLAGWPHWTAVLVEKAPTGPQGTGQRWAVDGWMFASGENPAIIETEKWYIEEKDSHRVAMR